MTKKSTISETLQDNTVNPHGVSNTGMNSNTEMETDKKYYILVVDDSKTVRTFFEDVFSDNNNYSATFAASGEEAVGVFKKSVEGGLEPFDFVLSDINMPGMNGFETLDQIKKLSPTVRTGMITGFNIDDYIKMALDKGIFNIICKMDSREEISRTVHNLITGKNLFGIENYLKPGAYNRKYKITETGELKSTVNAILAHAAKFLQEDKIYALKTGLVEMGTNAIYHAYNYEKGMNVALRESEEVYISYGYDDEKLAVVISDMSGSLTREKVVSQLNKCINPTEEDLTASGGRGIYLTRYLCDRVIINLEKKKRTEIILIMNFSSDTIESKPLLINQI